MISIFKREIKAYFRGMSGYLYLAAFFLMSGYFFVVNNVIGGDGDISGVFSGIYIASNFLVPLLTMDTLLTHQGYGIEYMIYTSPIQVVLGKFFAIFALIGIGVLGIVVYHLLLMPFWDQSLKMLIFNQISMMLVSGVCISVGMFASSISFRRTQALIMAYTLLLMFFLLDRSMESFVNFSQLQIIGALSIFSGYANFEVGIFSPTDLMRMLVFCMIVLGAAASMVSRRKQRGI
ncbi:MAG: hypothetical protein IKK29_04140 [Christensenellaceae bacterium]|nr:hypothetical protein [Christensenellaceae bacterium]